MGLLRRLRALLLPAVLLPLLLSAQASAQGEASASGDQLCALIVQRLARYVTWPSLAAPAQGSPFLLAATDARQLRAYFPDPSASSGMLLTQWPATPCHILLLNGTPPRDAAALVNRLADRPVLTVGYQLESPPPGLIVNIVEDGGRLRLQIDMQAARKAGLAISSRLLQLAQVQGGAGD